MFVGLVICSYLTAKIKDSSNKESQMKRQHVEGTLRIRVSEKSIEAVGFLIQGKGSSYEEPDRSKRGSITEFSSHSATRLRRYLVNTSIDYISFITLTLPESLLCGMSGILFKERFDVFCKALKRKFADLSLVWVLEFTRKGMPHLHCLCNTFVSKSFLSSLWSSVWSEFVDDKTYDDMLVASTSVKSINNYQESIEYLCYLYKDKQKVVPASFLAVGRFWGIRGRRAVVAADTYEIPVYAVSIEGMKETFKDEIANLNEQLSSCGVEPIVVIDINDYVSYGCVVNSKRNRNFYDVQWKLRSLLLDYYVESTLSTAIEIANCG